MDLSGLVPTDPFPAIGPIDLSFSLMNKNIYYIYMILMVT